MSVERLINKCDRILVTGSNGFIGAKVVEHLLEYGFANLRCFVRPSSGLVRLQGILGRFEQGKTVELISGDLLSRDDCREATEGVSLIYHLAAGFDKSFAGAFMNSALATRNLIEEFLHQEEMKRFVNVSSFAVYSNLNLSRGALLDENSPLEEAPQQRYDAYGFGKLKQEQLVRDYGESHALPYVILRPGTVYGPGKRELTGRIGVNIFGFFVHIGGSNRLPMTYVDNCAEAIVLAGLKPGIDKEIYNVVDNETLTSRQFLRAYRARVTPFFSLRLPYFAAYLLSVLWERYSIWSKGQLPPVFNRRRCAAEWKGNRFSNEKLRRRLGWKPRICLKQGMNAYLDQFVTTSV